MGVYKSEYRFNSKEDNLSISCLSVEPEKKEDVRGIVQLVHGMTEYKERYENFMTFLANNGYICAIHDHRGHGKSVKHDDDLGYMYDGGYKALIEDTHQHTKMIKEYAAQKTGRSDLPFILFGHSMGSLVVRSYIKRYDNEIDKLIVCGCPSPQPGVVPGLIFIDLLKLIKGDHARSKVADNLVMGSRYEKKFANENLKNAWLNTDREAVIKYNADKYCTFTFTLNGYDNLVRLTKETYSPKGYTLANAQLRVKFFSGAEDPCGISENDIQKAVDIMQRAGYQNISKCIYPGMRHEILNESGKQQVYDDMLSFINE